MLDCLIATCSEVPQLDPDDRLLLDELRARGLAVEVGVWNDASVDWSAARLCLIRATWDYPKHYHEFCAWLDDLDSRTTVRNSTELVRWNSDKSYLRELGKAGVPTVPTAWLRRGESVDLAQLLKSRGWPQAIVKPARGAAALDVMRVRASDPHGPQRHIERLLRSQDALVQPYIHEVEAYPERSLVFIEGTFSHAVSKSPFDTKLVIADSSSWLVEATQAERAVAAFAVAAVPGEVPLYSRVDLFRTGEGAVLVNELELIEPALYFGAYPTAAVKVADAIGRSLAAASLASG